jgi:hypothetical protein
MLKRLIRGIAAVIIISCSLLFIFSGFKILNISNSILPNLGNFLKKVSVDIPSTSREETERIPLGESKEIAVKIGLFADSEGDWDNLQKALTKMEDLSVSVAFFLGDLTRWGSKEELLAGKEILSASNLEIFVIPGDHDLAASVADGDETGRKNFLEVFGNNMYMYENSGNKFVLFDNSPNFSPISDGDFDWFRKNIGEDNEADFVILSQPLYHPINSRIMGIIEGNIVSTVHEQAQEMLTIIRDSKVKAIIAADQHLFSNSADPERNNLRHIVIGALVSNDEELRNPQAPRFSILEIYTDGTYRVNDIVL